MLACIKKRRKKVVCTKEGGWGTCRWEGKRVSEMKFFLHVDAASDDLLDGSATVRDIGCAVPEQGQELDDAEDQAQESRFDLFCRHEEKNLRIESEGVVC